MRLILLTLFTLVVLSNPFLSQNIKEIEGFPVDNKLTKKKTDFVYILGQTNDGYYLVSRSARYDYYIIHLDLDKKFKKIIPLNLKFKDEKMKFEKLIFHDGKLVLFSSFMNNKSEVYYLFSSTVNLQTLERNNDTKKMLEMDISNYKGLTYPQVKYEYSKDKSKLLIFLFMGYQKIGPNGFLSYNIVDSDLNSIFKKENIEMLVVNDVESASIDNKGNVYFLGVEAENKSTFFGTGKLYKPLNNYLTDMVRNYSIPLSYKTSLARRIDSYYLLDFPINGKDSIIQLHKKNKLFFYDMSIDIVSDSLINVYGSLQKEQQTSAVGTQKSMLVGLVQFKFNPLSKDVKKDTLNFDNYFLTQGWTRYHHNLYSQINYYIHPIIYTSTGESYVMLEEFYSLPNEMSLKSVFYDLIYVHIDANGKMGWFNKISKTQHNSSPSIPFIINNELKLIYRTTDNEVEDKIKKTYYSELTKSGPKNTKEFSIISNVRGNYRHLLNTSYINEKGDLYMLGSTSYLVPKNRKYVFTKIKF
jgi:hypothetical protein